MNMTNMTAGEHENNVIWLLLASKQSVDRRERLQYHIILTLQDYTVFGTILALYLPKQFKVVIKSIIYRDTREMFLIVCNYVM